MVDVEWHADGCLDSYEELRIRIEETLLLGKLLDRAPVLPEAVWVTECTSET